jgi:beta-lactamase superfamily II metal-dependent hydrolase
MPNSAVLEVHVINVGQGDSILIVHRDLLKLRVQLGTSVNSAVDDIDLLPKAMKDLPAALKGTVVKALLIDAGEDMYGESVVAYLESQGVLTKGTTDAPDLSVLMTHYHSDHIGGLPYLFIEQKESKTPKTVQRKNPTTKKMETKTLTVTTKTNVARYRPGKLYFAEQTKEDNRIGAYNLVFDWAAKGASAITMVPIAAGGCTVGSFPFAPVTIDLGTGVGGIPIKLRAVSAIAKVLNPATGGLMQVPVNNRVDPNDRSVVLTLEYGSFRGFLAADIAGNGLAAGGNGAFAMATGTKKPFSQHGDVESVLLPVMAAIYPATATAKKGDPKFAVAGHATFHKVGHHGSSSSTDIYSLGLLTPRVAVISSGLKERFHHHPTAEVMGRLGDAPWATAAAPSTVVANSVKTATNQPCGIFVTEIAANVRKTNFTVALGDARNIGDVIVRPVDETIAAAQDATTLGSRISVQIFGSGVQTELDGGTDTTLRPNAPTAGTGIYPIGPFTLVSDKH